jgi:hypothetical protein
MLFVYAVTKKKLKFYFFVVVFVVDFVFVFVAVLAGFFMVFDGVAAAT